MLNGGIERILEIFLLVGLDVVVRAIVFLWCSASGSIQLQIIRIGTPLSAFNALIGTTLRLSLEVYFCKICVMEPSDDGLADSVTKVVLEVADSLV